MPTVVIVGDHLSHPETHAATDAALRHAATDLGVDLEAFWMATETITPDTATPLAGVDAMLVPPGHQRSPEGAIAAIAVARNSGVPLLGTCGGMQLLVTEFARNVVGAVRAAHAEHDPDAEDPWITRLDVSLAGTSQRVHLLDGTLAAEAYRSSVTTERYYASFGVDPARVGDLVGAGMVVSGTDETGAPHIVEVSGHPFLIGTLFAPQMTSRHGAPHPLFTGLLAAAATREAG